MTGWPGRLNWRQTSDPAVTPLLAAPVSAALAAAGQADVVAAAIDPELSDTAAFCDAYAVSMADSANCVIIAARRGAETRWCACVVLATTRADVNGVVRRRMDARKASFAPMSEATERTAMQYGGITPIGLPADWPVLVDSAVLERVAVVIGSGLRDSKIALAPRLLVERFGGVVVEGLASPAG